MRFTAPANGGGRPRQPGPTMGRGVHPPMQIRVLGCSGSIAAGCRTTSYLIGADILVDAGTGVGDLTLDEMAAHRPHPGQPLAPGPCAGHRPAGRQRDAPSRRAAAPARAGARAAGDAGRAAAPHLQRRDLARFHPPAQRRAPGAGAAPVCRRRRVATGRPAHRGAAGCAHRAGGRLCGFHATTVAPGSSPATPGPTRRCGPAWRNWTCACWSSKPPSATTSWPWRASAATCAPPC